MKRRLMVWAGAGFLIACCFVIYTLIASPEHLMVGLRSPLVELFAFASLPVRFALGGLAIHFWWVPLINAATYAAVGALVELLRRKPKPGFAV